MINSILLASAFLAPQNPPPTSRPTSRPVAKRPTDRQRLRPADWGEDAPGRAVMPQKFLPITSAPYASAEKVKDRVTDGDLVIGLEVGGKAVAYPINMLGGPQREIINEDYAGVRFCVNW